MAKAKLKVYIGDKEIRCFSGTHKKVENLRKLYEKISFEDYNSTFTPITEKEFKLLGVEGYKKPERPNIVKTLTATEKERVKNLLIRDYRRISDNDIKRVIDEIERSQDSAIKIIHKMRVDHAYRRKLGVFANACGERMKEMRIVAKEKDIVDIFFALLDSDIDYKENRVVKILWDKLSGDEQYMLSLRGQEKLRLHEMGLTIKETKK